MESEQSKFGVDQQTSALLAIDFQRDILMDPNGKLHEWAEDAVARAADLVAWCRVNQIPVIWVRVQRRQDYADVFAANTDARLRRPPSKDDRRLLAGTIGVELVPQLVPDEGDYHVLKPRVNAFYATPLEVILRRLEVETLLVAGVYTHMGVEATVRGAYDRDFNVVVIADACGAPSSTLHTHALERILPNMAVVRSLERLATSREE